MPRTTLKTDAPQARPAKPAAKAKAKAGAPPKVGPHFDAVPLCKGVTIPLARRPYPMARRFAQITSAIWAEACADESLNISEFSVLSALRRDPDLDQISLAAYIGVDRTNLGLIIDALEKNGLVERRVNPKDRRARLLVVTPAGEAAHVRQLTRTGIVQEKIFAPLTAAERETFYDLLERIIAANEQYAIPGAGRRKRSG